MKVLQINSTFKNGGSTGRIVYDLSETMTLHGIKNYVGYGINCGVQDHRNTFLFQSHNEMLISQLQSRLFSHHGFYNIPATNRLLNYIDSIKPDIIHLHNIHGYYVNCDILFDYVKHHNIPVVWTLHDCWAFTGWCAYFDYSGCEKWKTQCHHCPSKKDYPKAWISSRSSSNYIMKKTAFTGVENLQLVTPSKWLANLTRESYLKNYPVQVINNGVDTDIFSPKSKNIKDKIGVGNRKMILAVAGGLEKRKGRDYLLKIPTLLNDDEVLVILGIRAEQQSVLPNERCIGIPYTSNMDGLADIYSSADAFLNTTLEDNFPTTNIEALSCGTPVITFNTGGSIEAVLDYEDNLRRNNGMITSSVGGVVPKGDIQLMIDMMREILFRESRLIIDSCRKKALRYYNKNNQYEEYIKIYEQLYESRNK